MRTKTQTLPASLLAGMTALVISAGATVAAAQDDVQGAGGSAQQTVGEQAAATGELDRQRSDAEQQDSSAASQSSADKDRRDREAPAVALEESNAATRSEPPAHATPMPESAASLGAATASADEPGGETPQTAATADEPTPALRSIPPAHATRAPTSLSSASSSAGSDNPREESAAMSAAQHRSARGAGFDEPGPADSSPTGVVTSRASEEPATESAMPARAANGTVRESMPSTPNIVARERGQGDEVARDNTGDNGAASENSSADSAGAAGASGNEATRSVPPAYATPMPQDARTSRSATAAMEQSGQDNARSADEQLTPAARSATSSSTLATRDAEDAIGSRGSTETALRRPSGMTASIVSKFEALDTNHNGLIDAAEADASDGLSAQFSALDSDGDGTLSLSEFGAASNLASIKRDRDGERQQ